MFIPQVQYFLKQKMSQNAVLLLDTSSSHSTVLSLDKLHQCNVTASIATAVIKPTDQDVTVSGLVSSQLLSIDLFNDNEQLRVYIYCCMTDDLSMIHKDEEGNDHGPM
jgi:hypothetical protein